MHSKHSSATVSRQTLVDSFRSTMMPLMQKMAAPLPLASALCHVATVAVMMNMHIQLSTVQDTATGPHRTLLDSDGDSLVTVAHMNKAVGHLQDTLGSRLTAVERESSDLKALVETLTVNQTDPDHSGPAHSDGGVLDAHTAFPLDFTRETAAANDTKEDTATAKDGISFRTWMNLTLHRRTQVAPQACARVQDFQALSAAAMDACCPANGGGHRRLQASCALPATCPSAACAAVFVPFMDDCATMLSTMPGVPVADFQSFAASCVEMQAGAGEMLQPVAVQMFRVLVNTEGAAQAGAMFPGGGEDGSNPLDPLQPLPPVPPPPLDVMDGGDETIGVTQYHAECTSADVASCVPPCNAEHHGYELLATIDGTDTKFSCNLAHGLYSWMGAASEGGYLGADAQSFFSAVVSGAAGSYIVTLTEDAGISTDLTIQLGQDVHISAESGLLVAPRWGSGGFTVQQGGKLALDGIILAGAAVLDRGGTLSVNNCFAGSVGLQLPSALASTGWSGLWNSGTVTNLNGKSFTLVRLDPAQPPGYFSSDVQGEQRYAALCAAAGLHTVTTGQPDDVHHEYGYPTYTNCGQYGCIPLADDALSQANPSYAARWVHDTVGWTNIVTDYGMQHHGATVPSNFICLGGTAPANCDQHQDSWDAWALHPVCGMEAIPATGR